MPNGKRAKPKSKPKKKTGRKEGITAARVRVLVKAIGCGLPKVHAARLAKITDRTLFNWMEMGEEAFSHCNDDESKVPKPLKLHVQLFLGVRKAMADTMQDALNNIAEAGEKNWQASAWLLTRLCPGRFADQRREFADLKRQCAELLAEVVRLRNQVPAPRSDTPQSEADQKAGAAVTVPGAQPVAAVPPVAESVNVTTPTVEGGFLPLGV